MTVRITRVELGDRGYDVVVGSGLLGRLDELLPGGRWERVMVVTDRNVGPLYSGEVDRCLSGAGLDVKSFALEPGEGSKSAHRAFELLNIMAAFRMGREDLLVALGGGVVGDVAGFAASVYKRGMPYLQVPTTLMAQVDSSIGGKTGVNLDCGKNLVGTFHQPVAVLSDVDVMRTLPEREYTSGLAEVAKYSFLWPDRWPGTLAASAENLRALDTGEMVAVVDRCAGIKAGVVSSDEFDRSVRAVLNYGHTMGHALEAVAGYGSYTHGEAVSIGMVYAGIVSEEMGDGPPGISEGHRETLALLGLPIAPRTPPGFDAVLDAMRHDKKNRNGITMVLLDRDGTPVVTAGLETGTLKRCYRRLIGGA